MYATPLLYMVNGLAFSITLIYNDRLKLKLIVTKEYQEREIVSNINALIFSL